MAIVGLPQFEAFALKYPGESLYQMACQGSELLIGLGKLFCDKSGTGKYDMPKQMADFYDITGTCMVYHNKIDFTKILKKLQHKKLLIFNANETPQIEQLYENQFPSFMTEFIDELENFNVGDVIPSLLAKISSQLTLPVWSLQMSKIRSILSTNYKKINTQDIDENSVEYQECLEQLNQWQNGQKSKLKNSLKYQSQIIP